MDISADANTFAPALAELTVLGFYGDEYKCLPTGIKFGQPRVCQMCRTELVKLQKVL